MRLLNPPIVLPSPGPPTEADPWEVPQWPGWVWWRGRDWRPHARNEALQLEVEARSLSFVELLGEIRKAEGGAGGGRGDGAS